MTHANQNAEPRPHRPICRTKTSPTKHDKDLFNQARPRPRRPSTTQQPTLSDSNLCQTSVKPIGAIRAISSTRNPPIHADPNPPSTDPNPPPCPNQTTNLTQLRCKPWTRKRDVRWEKEGHCMEWETERESGSEREKGLKEREPWNKKLIFSLELYYSAILKVELHWSKYCKKFAILGFDIPWCRVFWGLNAKFLLHMALALENANALICLG